MVGETWNCLRQRCQQEYRVYRACTQPCTVDTRAGFTWCKIHRPSGGPCVLAELTAHFSIAAILPEPARVIYMLRVIFVFAQFVPVSAGLGLGLTRI